MSTFCNDFAKILAKPHPNCHVVWVKLPPPIIMIWRAVRMRRMEEDTRWGRLPSIWGIRAYGKTQKLAVKGILSGRDVFVQAIHARAKDTARACVCWARDKVRDFLEYFKFHENSEC